MDKNLEKVSPKVREHIEKAVLPRYSELRGHTVDHIDYVIRRSLKFAGEIPEINFDMVYIIAAYHDLGRLVNNENHNFESAKMLLKDKFLAEKFSEEERRIMAEAVEDHRASLKREPRSVYGKIVSSADRNTEVSQAVKRSFNYSRALHPDYSVEKTIEDARVHLREKFGAGGYARGKMYFKDSEYEKFCEEIEEITKAPEEYLKVAKRILGV
ncbi:HD domain-containing protein [Candidatus Saccharibacteria bacterium]|nr:HD domain-containing protein [Candidatus Saccharibacteria bacterium]